MIRRSMLWWGYNIRCQLQLKRLCTEMVVYRVMRISGCGLSYVYVDGVLVMVGWWWLVCCFGSSGMWWCLNILRVVDPEMVVFHNYVRWDNLEFSLGSLRLAPRSKA